MVRSFRQQLNPTHWVYLLVHALLVASGAWMVAYFKGRTVPVAVGTSLVAAGAAGVVIFVYVLLSSRTAERLDILTRFGFTDAFEGRGARIREEYDQRIARARQHIDVMGFGLRALREDHLASFRSGRLERT